MEELKRLGWNDRIEMEYQNLGLPSHEPGRVASADRGKYVVLTKSGVVPAVASGKLIHNSPGAVGIPAVGDWVALRSEAGVAAIERILPRSSCLIRKSSGRDYQAQVIAVNLDNIFIVTSVGRDLNPRRIERHLAAAHAAGAEPVVVINKRDLPHRRDDVMAEIEGVALSVKVIMTSVVEDGGLDEMWPLLISGETVALIGSSGVGKSSLVNKLIGYDRQRTLSVRETDEKGRHVTSRRELILAPAGFLIVDTPGMREFGLWEASEGLAEAFSDITELSAQCRFRDCSHQAEPGCAARQAAEAGLLPPGRLQSYLRLITEQQNAEQRARDREDKKDSKARWKERSKNIRQQKRLHKKLGQK